MNSVMVICRIRRLVGLLCTVCYRIAMRANVIKISGISCAGSSSCCSKRSSVVVLVSSMSRM